MSDVSQGPGWWQAADLKWYPPELHADYEEPASPRPGPPGPPDQQPQRPPPSQASGGGPGPGWWQAADLKWYPPELHADYVTPPPTPRPPDEQPQQPADPHPAATPTQLQLWWWRQRRQVIAALIAVIVLIVAVSGITGYLLLAGWRTSQPSTTAPPPTALPPSTTSTPTVTPVAEAALEGLLLSPGQINTAMGVTGMTVSGPKRPTSMYTDTDVPDKACLHLDNAKEAAVYGGSGWTSVYGQELDDPLKWPHRVNQAVVLFSSAHDADAFFSASAQSWPACSNRQFTETEPEPDVVFTVGPVSNANSTLSATTTRTADGWTCHRALTVANNVAIDVGVCGYNKSDFQSYSAINIAQQIAAKVPT